MLGNGSVEEVEVWEWKRKRMKLRKKQFDASDGEDIYTKDDGETREPSQRSTMILVQPLGHTSDGNTVSIGTYPNRKTRLFNGANPLNRRNLPMVERGESLARVSISRNAESFCPSSESVGLHHETLFG